MKSRYKYLLGLVSILATLILSIPIIKHQTLKSSDCIVLAKEKIQNKDYHGALAHYSKAIELDPNNIDAYNGRGRLEVEKLENVNAALDDFNKALKIKPNAESYLNRASAKLSKSRAEAIKSNDQFISKMELSSGRSDALEDINKAIQIDPNCSDAYRKRADIKGDTEYSRDREGELSDYNKAIELNPSNYDAYLFRGYLKQLEFDDKQGGLADRIIAVNMRVQLEPNNPDAYKDRADLRLRDLKNDEQNAILDYKQAQLLYQEENRHQMSEYMRDKIRDIESNL